MAKECSNCKYHTTTNEYVYGHPNLVDRNCLHIKHFEDLSVSDFIRIFMSDVASCPLAKSK